MTLFPRDHRKCLAIPVDVAVRHCGARFKVEPAITADMTVLYLDARRSPFLLQKRTVLSIGRFVDRDIECVNIHCMHRYLVIAMFLAAQIVMIPHLIRSAVDQDKARQGRLCRAWSGYAMHTGLNAVHRAACGNEQSLSVRVPKGHVGGAVVCLNPIDLFSG